MIYSKQTKLSHYNISLKLEFSFMYALCYSFDCYISLIFFLKMINDCIRKKFMKHLCFFSWFQVLRSTVRQLPISRLSSKQRTNLLQRKSTAIWHALRTRLTFSLCSTQSLTSLLPTTLEDVASTEHKTLLIFPITALALAPQETNFYFLRHLSLCSHLLLLIHFKPPKVVCLYKWDFFFFLFPFFPF